MNSYPVAAATVIVTFRLAAVSLQVGTLDGENELIVAFVSVPALNSTSLSQQVVTYSEYVAFVITKSSIKARLLNAEILILGLAFVRTTETS